MEPCCYSDSSESPPANVGIKKLTMCNILMMIIIMIITIVVGVPGRFSMTC